VCYFIWLRDRHANKWPTRKAKMFDPTSRADVTVTSVRYSVCGQRRSAASIQTKCVSYQNRLCCDGVEILQLETVSCVFTLRYFWAAASNALCICVDMRPEIPAGWWPCRLRAMLQNVVWSLLVVSFESGERCVCVWVTFIGDHHIFPFSLSWSKTYACALFCSC